ncbi:MAG TPA: SHOCT domain-containing protein [Actinomycetes bacterium]|nr:SHOCT domain-containing protein [Actinomycetes bacterium]
MVRIVPRQLQRAGMTGSVPYYGGRLSPAQAYAVSHQARPSAQGSGSQAGSASAASRPPGDLTAQLTALQELLDDGVLTEDEFRTLRERVLQ